MRTQLPNLITLIRLILGVWFPFAPIEWRLPLLILAALTDALDGELARWLRVTDGIGKYLDPICDKVFIAGVLVALLRDGVLTAWAALALGLRDLGVIAGVIGLYCLRRREVLTRLHPTFLGKFTTFAQFVYLLILILGNEPPAVMLPIIAVISGLAGGQYIANGGRELRRSPREPNREQRENDRRQ